MEGHLNPIIVDSRRHQRSIILDPLLDIFYLLARIPFEFADIDIFQELDHLVGELPLLLGLDIIPGTSEDSPGHLLKIEADFDRLHDPGPPFKALGVTLQAFIGKQIGE
jgi:hypothetical protein